MQVRILSPALHLSKGGHASLFIAALVLLLVISPFTGDICEKQPNSYEKDCATYHLAFVIVWHIAKALNDFGAAITAVATAFLVWVTWTLAGISKRQTDSLRIIERAYIFITVQASKNFTRTINGITEVKDYPASLKISNRGRTPAVFTKFRALLIDTQEYSIDGLPETVIDRDMPDGMAIPGNGRWNYPLPLYASENEMAEINSGARKLFACGVVFYTDMFGDSHETGFCWEYHPSRNIFKVADNYKLNYRK